MNESTESPIVLSVLDVSPVSSGYTSADALHNTLDLARLADELGYKRYWLAEHHNSSLIASSSPEVMIGHVADVTTRIRVGSGGVMLPNHVPLKVAETFRTLEALHPGRIDLGLGRAPGTDGLTALALRRTREALHADDFPEQVEELLAFFDKAEFPPNHPFKQIVAAPVGVPAPDIWLLGSSDFSARLAASLGLGFGFAHHINPTPAIESLRLYHELFQPSEENPKPNALIAISAICAETDAEAEKLASSADLTLLRFRSGKIGPVPSVEEATEYPYTPMEREEIRWNRERLFVGSPATLKEKLSRFAQVCGVQEIVVTSLIHEHAKRRRSYELLTEAFPQ